jgi:mono/diheme cytochrome c family protein
MSHAVDQENQRKEESPTVSDEQLARAKVIFKEKCARCHGADGRGQTVLGTMLVVPDFTDKKWWKDDVSDERLLGSITNGKVEMPAFGKKLTKQKIVSLVAYLRRFNKSPQ